MTRTSISHNLTYPEFCELAARDDNVFKSFRKNKIYVETLEHVSIDIAKKYINKIKSQKKQLLNLLPKFKTNDKFGDPTIVNFGKEFGNIAPTTIRYISVLHDICNKFNSLDEQTVIEVGCGYGGQCKLLFDVFNIKDYTLIDLQGPINLIRKYLSCYELDKKVNLVPYQDIKEKKCDLFISNYAFSECVKEVQNQYFENYIKHSAHGFMLYNFTSQIYGIKSFTLDELVNKLKANKKQVKVEEEVPNTFAGNKLILW